VNLPLRKHELSYNHQKASTRKIHLAQLYEMLKTYADDELIFAGFYAKSATEEVNVFAFAYKYVKQIEYDKSTGEIITPASMLSFNDDALAEDEKYDGYYVIVTSRHFESDEWVIETYKGLWRIEETFRVTKSELVTRPVHVSREDRIEAHFLTCFVALVIIRLLQKNLDYKFSTAKILDSLAKSCCSRIKNNVHMFDSSSSPALGAGE